ncbi:MAG TPA: class I SAM-dependent methyltransferase [Vicinamibacterales bacterium]|jgi:O-methyltransferase involved in polyketide biosynthesis|nr:class I SAM-dependent methyltransferase [Vicinamibacterales bacterium]
MSAALAASFPPAKDLVKIRTKYLDDTLETQLFADIRHVVLGAGLDTRLVRKQSAGVACCEIDEAATLAIKLACYARQRFDVDVKLIAGNYVTDGLSPMKWMALLRD